MEMEEEYDVDLGLTISEVFLYDPAADTGF